ncbi:MAG: TIGR04086 family membrane protein [Clostridia bacterium]|nr:TIGR04086 family membrane protein [Clostridia bacterium]
MSKPKRNKTDNKLQIENIMLFIFPVILTLVLFVISAIVSVYTDLQRSQNYIVSLCIIGFVCFASGVLSGKFKRKNGIITGIIYILPQLTLLLLISVIFNSFSIDINIIISTAVSVISAAVGGITGVNMKQKAKRVKK